MQDICTHSPTLTRTHTHSPTLTLSKILTHAQCSPINGDADENVGGQEEAKDPEECHDPAKRVARHPHDRRGPGDLQRHHHERHLLTKMETSSRFIRFPGNVICRDCFFSELMHFL